MNEVNNKMVITWLCNYAKALQTSKDQLNEYDREIGDGDHGENMSRGFNAVVEKISPMTDSDIGTILKTTAMTLISTVGGASGPLYGSFFLKASQSANGKMNLNPDEVGMMLQAGFQSVQTRGKAVVGDKTMIDAMQPAIEAFQLKLSEGLREAANSAAIAARKGAESTVPIIAKKGRASYLGERSIGHMDAGCFSTQLLFEEFSRIF